MTEVWLVTVATALALACFALSLVLTVRRGPHAGGVT